MILSGLEYLIPWKTGAGCPPTNVMCTLSSVDKETEEEFTSNIYINYDEDEYVTKAIYQNVTITAEFPNVTNREEIKEAFGDLVNLAAQYASRK